MVALALSNKDDLTTRDELIARYRRMRGVSRMHHSKVLSFMSRHAVVEVARRLGLVQGKTITLDQDGDLWLAFDLAIYTAPAGRTSAIDRYARSAQLEEGSDEEVALAAMRSARFAVLVMDRRHPVAGLIVRDVFRGEEIWLLDEGLEASLTEGSGFATRYYVTDRFAMTAGVLVPCDVDLLSDALDSAPGLMRKSQAELVDDPRFAEVLYRTALARGVMENVQYQDLPGADAAA